MRVSVHVFLLFLVLLLPSVCLFGNPESFNSDYDFAQVENVKIVARDSGKWDIYVSVRHKDEGWDHYADRWQVLDDTDGRILGERILAHPHDKEQPFTRSLSGVNLGPDIQAIRVRSSCPNHGFGGKEVLLEIPPGEKEVGFTLESQNGTEEK